MPQAYASVAAAGDSWETLMARGPAAPDSRAMRLRAGTYRVRVVAASGAARSAARVAAFRVH